MTASLKVLTELRHPFILTPILAQFTGKEFIVIREFIESGSLKDAIYGKAPKTNFLVKYGQSSTTRNLSLANIRQYGRQILEAVNFLYEKGFVMGKQYLYHFLNTSLLILNRAHSCWKCDVV